jgi:UDP-N-acetylmuramoyl-L-alanyl-D-glutamate--2,6-diaminopimelate ligase
MVDECAPDGKAATAAPVSGLARPVPARFPWAEPFFTVGVTGTNGKTSTTHLVASVVRAAGVQVLCQSTLGYFTNGEPFPIERSESGFLDALHVLAERGGRHAVVEVTSLALLKGYAKKWRFDLGVFTNLTRDHVAEHGSWEHYLAAKAQLFVHLGPGRTAVLNAGDEGAMLVDQATPRDVVRRYYYAPGRGPLLHSADLAAHSFEVTLEGTRITLEPSPTAEALGGELVTQLVGEVFGENVLGAALAGLGSGFDAEVVRRGLGECGVLPARFEVLHRRPTVVLDYAHTPDAIARLCATARRIAGAGRIILVFGAGGNFDVGKREPMGEAAARGADLVFLANDNPRKEDPAAIIGALERGCQRGSAEVRIVYDRADAIRCALEASREQDVVLVAGRGHDRGMVFANGVMPYSDPEVVAELCAGRGPA